MAILQIINLFWKLLLFPKLLYQIILIKTEAVISYNHFADTVVEYLGLNKQKKLGKGLTPDINFH